MVLALPSSVTRPVISPASMRSEEHTSELQSQSNLVCRLLLEKKKTRDAPPLRCLVGTHAGGGLGSSRRRRLRRPRKLYASAPSRLVSSRLLTPSNQAAWRVH